MIMILETNVVNVILFRESKSRCFNAEIVNLCKFYVHTYNTNNIFK